MKIGDLVKFNTPDLFSASRDAYPKFGVVVGVRACYIVDVKRKKSVTRPKEAPHDNL